MKVLNTCVRHVLGYSISQAMLHIARSCYSFINLSLKLSTFKVWTRYCPSGGNLMTYRAYSPGNGSVPMEITGLS